MAEKESVSTDTTEEKKPGDPFVEKWINRRTDSEATQIPMFNKISGYYDEFYAVVENIESPWRSELHLPEFFSIIMTKAAIITSKPLSWEISGRTKDDHVAAQVMKEVMNYQLREPHVKPSHYKRFSTGVIDALVTGTALFEVPFRIQKDIFRKYPINDKTGLIDTSKTEVTERIARWNEFKPIDHIRFFKDPYSSSIQDSGWILIEDFVTEDSLRAQNKRTPGFYDSLSGIRELRGDTDRLGIYNDSRNKLLNVVDKIAQDSTVKYIKLWKCYERKYHKDTGESFIEYSEILGGTKVIRNPKQQPYWHNLYPIAVMYDYDRPHEFWGVGEIEVSNSLVKGINDNVNQYFDNKNLSNNSMIMRKASTVMEPFIIEPGGEIIYDGDVPTQFRFPDPDAQTFQLAHTTLLQGLERSSGISGYLSGVPASGVDKTRGTKGGIEIITQNAQNRMGYTQRQIGDFMEQVGRIWLSNTQQFFTEDFMVRLADGNKLVVSPEEIQGEYDLFVSDNSLTPSSREEKLNMILGMFSQLEAITPALTREGKMIKISDQVIKYLKLLGEAKPEDIVVDAPAPEKDSASEIKKNVSISFAGNELPPEIQTELLTEQFEAGDEEEPLVPPQDPQVVGGVGGLNSPPGSENINPNEEPLIGA